MKKLALFLFFLILLGVASFSGFWFGQQYNPESPTFPIPFVSQEPARPLLAYTIPNLANRDYQTSTIKFEKVLEEEPTYTSYLFSYQTLGKKMTGVANIPTQAAVGNPVKAIVLLRGYVPIETYTSGTGTRNAAAYFAEHGYLTFAPDFFDYGESDLEPEDTWQARFEKPITVIELLKTLEEKPVIVPKVVAHELSPTTTAYPINFIGIWAHSNGGQIALTTLEILNKPIPTTLWAPVTAPFPYSILFFSDESDDEGKAMREYVSSFEKNYDVFDFSLTRHLDRLQGPLQLHQGLIDDAVIPAWSDEFVAKIKAENQMREGQATAAAKIDLTYFTYPGADHNLQPKTTWDTVISRDLTFFNNQL